MPYRILILGAYGNFGRRLCLRLARSDNLQLILAGRSLAKAEALLVALRAKALPALCSAQALDAQSTTLAAEIRASGAQLLIHTGGPFQGQEYQVAQACIEAGVHYLDLADGCEFVTGIGRLDQAARARGLVVISGASSVPGLSSAVVQSLRSDFAELDVIATAIAPGNRTERGDATVAAILSYVGKASRVWRDQQWQTVYGWQDLHRHLFPEPIGPRWLAHCEVPDLSLFPEHYHGVKTVRFSAGLELPLLHFGLYALSWVRRLGLVRDWSRYTEGIIRMSRWFEHRGTDAGGMVVTVTGQDHNRQPLRRQWQLLAGSGDGPFVPTIAAALLAKKLARGDAIETGARACLEQFTLAEFVTEVSDLDIQFLCRELVEHD